jgi:hypothetical protein
VECSTGGLSNATSTTLQELRGEVSRIESNQEIQKKYLIKELVRVEEVAKSAMDHSEGVQKQVDSVRQQTKAMTDSMQAMHRHSDELTNGLKEMMNEFRELRFEMPGKFDDWLKVRLGQAEGRIPTISGEDLRRQSNAQPQIPSVPPLILPNLSLVPPVQAAEPTPTGTHSGPDGSTIPPIPNSSPSRNTSSSPPRPSSTELYRTYLNNQSSQDELSELERKAEVEGSGNDVEMPSAAETTNAWDGIEFLDRGAVSGQNEIISMDVDQVQSPQEKKDSQGEFSVGQTSGEGGVVLLEETEEGEIKEGMEIDVEGPPKMSTEIENNISVSDVAQPDPDPVSADVPTSEPPIAGLQAIPYTASQPCAPTLTPPVYSNPDIAPMAPLSVPSPISPEIIRSNSVEPPAGLLTNTWYDTSPLSSQPTIPSPSPHPNQRLLAIPVPNPYENGPVTRSRSRSPSFQPPQSSLSGQRTPQKPRSSRAKPKGRRE